MAHIEIRGGVVAVRRHMTHKKRLSVVLHLMSAANNGPPEKERIVDV